MPSSVADASARSREARRARARAGRGAAGSTRRDAGRAALVVTEAGDQPRQACRRRPDRCCGARARRRARRRDAGARQGARAWPTSAPAPARRLSRPAAPRHRARRDRAPGRSLRHLFAARRTGTAVLLALWPQATPAPPDAASSVGAHLRAQAGRDGLRRRLGRCRATRRATLLMVCRRPRATGPSRAGAAARRMRGLRRPADAGSGAPCSDACTARCGHARRRGRRWRASTRRPSVRFAGIGNIVGARGRSTARRDAWCRTTASSGTRCARSSEFTYPLARGLAADHAFRRPGTHWDLDELSRA